MSGCPLRFRAIDVGEQGRVAALAERDPACWVSAKVFAYEWAAGRFRSEWTWVAERDDRLLARAVWWGRSAAPLTLDCLWVDTAVEAPAAVAGALVAAGLDAIGGDRPPPYQLRLPASWQEDAVCSSAVAWRRRAVTAAGLTDEVDRLQWVRPAGTPLAPSRGRLRFEPDDDDAPFIDLFRRVAVGSLDDGTRRGVQAVGDEAFAREEIDFYRSAPGDRRWWRLARDASAARVGFVIPSATEAGPNVGYLGVVPEARGRGFVDELVAEATRLHVARGDARITATCDVSNLPMAAAFARQGYCVSERRLVFSAPAATTR